ncbi:MAG: hypothetical protein LZ172_04415 [Thaumarchaeota archaeon]|nr:hypothetical protein [Candidatus Geocrenenecus arthurdayi]MCL7389513.1 hypothetical protein [Candidatus Geocrenenecus arthurdayi]MCL7396409.1 hypothetical protein [Candidatus Geocrenenecus arthurdayi]MCL7403573.1 hypothetical protein [Candidatus Geocrenenecus arthurdayi]
MRGEFYDFIAFAVIAYGHFGGIYKRAYSIFPLGRVSSKTHKSGFKKKFSSQDNTIQHNYIK